MESRKYVGFGNLTQTLDALLGLNPNLTPNWVKSVYDIVRALPSQPLTHKDDDEEFLNSISRTKDELAALTTHLSELNKQRKQALNELLDLKGKIRVFCRVRPITLGENFSGLRPVTVAADSTNIVLKLDDNKCKSYSFDRVFYPGSSQEEVFSEIEPVIKSVLDGYNACIFAYGQTGTGKTFTMEGRADDPGVVPRTFESLFKQALNSNHSFLISFSMLEIYMGHLKDLLVHKPSTPTDPMSPCLSVQTDPDGGIEIENLVSIQVNDFHQALRLYRLGCRFRSTASTNSNITSSRSHCMIRLAITCFDAPERRRDTNKIWLVDLGGSERVLKTKASGKRFEEGKAINLSLSALGDVINALQRKKHHIPYRNSKLTQVLKDSLGDDSKTLMLVHVSPKEEDLCETICSLNFATRVKNIHLGNEDTIEVREKKELAMVNLHEKMTEIEHKQLHIKREIEILEKRLENLTGKHLFSEEQAEAYNIAEEPLKKNRTGDTKVAPKSKLPRFMRPTICSRRKTGAVYQCSEWKVPVTGRRRRPSSHRAESVTLPVNDHSDYKSARSVSRAGCLVTLSMSNSADNATDYSQDTSASDVKVIDQQEQRKEPTGAFSQMADTNHILEHAHRQKDKTNYIKFSKVDNWFDLQKNGTNMSGYTHMTKRILAIPSPKMKLNQKEQGKAKKDFDEEAYSFYDFRIQTAVNNNKKDKPVTGMGLGRPTSEVATDKPLTMPQNLFNGDLRSDFISASQKTEGKRIIKTHDEWSIFSPKDVCCHRDGEYKDDDDEANASSIMQGEEGKKQISGHFQLKNHRSCESLQPSLDSSITWSEGNSGGSISMLELELCCQQAPTESVIEDAERQDSDLLIQTSVKERRHDMLQLRSQKSLFMSYLNQKDLMKKFDELQGANQTTGICDFLKEKLEIFLATALLGLGFWNLGYENEFFYGLEF